MNSEFSQFVASVRREARGKKEPVTVMSWGQHVFHGYDWGGDTFVFEHDALRKSEGHQPILLVRKSALIKGASGYVMTISAGNHTVAAVPLLKGQFWNLGRVPAKRQSEAMKRCVICANLVDGKIEISQRGVSTEALVEADEWLQGLGLPLDVLVIAERNPETLEHYQLQGQEWRVKPLAWTRQEMEHDIRASRRRINSPLRYYHSVKGVHFLSYTEFHSLLEMDYESRIKSLRELVSVAEGMPMSYTRMERCNGHNEIELFGVPRREAVAKGGLVSQLELLMQEIALGRRITHQKVKSLEEIDADFKNALESPELADETSEKFIVMLYKHLTGAVYEGDSDSLAFDDRRTALPGATYWGGRSALHPGADARTRVLLANLDKVVTQDETIEYVNVYELRGRESANLNLGEGTTREIAVKTNLRPFCASMIEKHLSQRRPGSGEYLLARVHALKALGVNLGDYRLLVREDCKSCGKVNHFLRSRCPGYPLNDVPKRLYKMPDGQREDPAVALAMGALLGSAAAQNLAMKKYVDKKEGCRFGVGKEIFEFAYEINSRREMPVRLGICSVRGVLSWQSLSRDEANLRTMFDFYLTRYADVLVKFWRDHRAVDFQSLQSRFVGGFKLKTREMRKAYSVQSEQLDAFNPKVRPLFNFKARWDFALWALVCQEERLDALEKTFTEKVATLMDL